MTEQTKSALRPEVVKFADQIEKSTQLIAEIDGLISGETQKQLKAMGYKELTQTQYNDKVAELQS
jgi:hypothetical protein